MRQLGPALARVSGITRPAPAGEPRYRAFISYNHRDADCARWLHKALETYRVPRELVGQETPLGPVPRRIAPVFRDEDELAGASELNPVLEEALRDSAALVVICSPHSAASIWVDREIRFFRSHHPDRPVLTVIAHGVPGGDTDCFPRALRHACLPDGSLAEEASIEPLAPDLQKQDRQVVRLKLIAGLIGVRYSDLYRRDRRRARKLAAALGTLSLVIIVALSGLSIAAVTYARIAVAQRKVAEHQRDLADRRAWLAQQSAAMIRDRFVDADQPACPGKR